MINEDYVSFETAKLLKDKGFNEGCYFIVNATSKGMMPVSWPTTNSDIEDESASLIALPTLQMAMKWLREAHNIDIIALPQYDSIKWTYSAIIFKLLIPCTEIRLNDNKSKKEEACEEAIKYCLENLI